MTTKVLTDRAIAALKPAPSGDRYNTPDGIVPGLAVRVTDKGSKSFVLVARYPGSENPTRRALAGVGEITLAAAREKAREWLLLIKQGIDPTEREEEQRRAEESSRLAADHAQRASFSFVVEIFLKEHVSKLRTAPAVTRRLRNEVLPVWGDRSIHSITRDDVEDLIRGIKDRPAPEHARSVLDDVRMLFNWAVESVDRRAPHKLANAPTDHIRPKKLIGPRMIKTRVLDDRELRAVWIAAGNVGYPVGAMVKMLMLTGCRLNEVAAAHWREFNGGWVIPPERFKSKIEHRLPITEDLAALLATLPRFQSGDFLFSTQHGRKPVNGFSHAKDAIDKYMPADTPAWTFHDIRRTVRTRLSQLRVDREVAELVIGHGKKGLDRIYDQHKFEAEIRDALERWQGLLRGIVDPRPNVTRLPARA
jgi:integrase